MAAHGPRWARRLLLVAATGLLSGPAAGVNHPFGAHTSSYATGAILPDHVSQAAMDQAVRDLDFTARTKGSTFPAVVGPVRGTLVLGSTPAAGRAGACGLTASLACTGSGSTLRCG